jgi:hypothetical protein
MPNKKTSKTPEGNSPSTEEAENMQVPDLDQLITQITNNGDFKEMMSNISGGLTHEHDRILETTEVETDNDSANESSNEPESNLNKVGVNESQYDMMCSLFTDNEGNNVCEILNLINQNLTQLNQSVKILAESSAKK